MSNRICAFFFDTQRNDAILFFRLIFEILFHLRTSKIIQNKRFYTRKCRGFSSIAHLTSNLRIRPVLCKIWFQYWFRACILWLRAPLGMPTLANCLLSELSLCSHGPNLFEIASDLHLLRQLGIDQWSRSMLNIVQNVGKRQFSCPTNRVLLFGWTVSIRFSQCRTSCSQDIENGRLRLSCWGGVFYPYSMSRRIVSWIGDGL